MSSLNNIIQQALGSISLKKIRFKRDPGNHESMQSYEGYLLEEDETSNSATIFIPGLMDGIMNVGADSIEMIQPPVESSLCKLKGAAMECLIKHGHIESECELKQLDLIETLEQLEMYLGQFGLCDLQLLNIYRNSFKT